MPTLYMNNVVTGESRPLNVEGETVAECYQKAMELSGDQVSSQPIVISEHPFDARQATASDTPQSAATVLASAAELAALNLPTPAIPKPTSPTDLPPESSATLVVSVNPTSDLYVLGGSGAWYPVSSLPSAVTPFPSPVYAQFSTYWKQIGSAVITGPQTYTKSVAYTTGMSTTDSTTLSAEFGISYGALSAKLSATIGHSVTTSQQTTVTDSYQISVQAGTTSVYVLWQLMGEIIFLGPDMTPIEWSFKTSIGIGQISFTFPNSGRISQINTVYSDQTAF